MRWSSHLRGLLDESRSRGWRFEPARLGRRGPLTGQHGAGTTAARGAVLLCGVVAYGRVQARHDAKIERSTNNCPPSALSKASCGASLTEVRLFHRLEPRS